MAAAALALANNDVAQIVWRVDNRIPGCLGFALYRKEGTPDPAGPWVPLPAWVGFAGQSNPAWTAKTTEIWPVQKFEWKDLTAERGKTYSYKIVPVTGDPSSIAKLPQIAGQTLFAGPVTLTPKRDSFSTFFNRGILSTQFLAHSIPAGPSGAPNFKVLTDRIDQPGDPLRIALAGQILEGLESLLARANQAGGSLYAALYELTDPELVQLLLQAKDKLHLILSNTGTDDTENQPARQSLHDVGVDIIDRFVPSGHIGHNKFMIYVDASGQEQAVLLGSTNWTDTAICAQANNTLVVEDQALAQTYMRYWQRLKDDTDQSRARQGPALRDADAQPGATDLPIDSAQATVWFSPNTPHAGQSHPNANEATPPDLQEVFDLMNGGQAGDPVPGVPARYAEHRRTGSQGGERQPGSVRARRGHRSEGGTGVQHPAVPPPPASRTWTVVPASAINDQFAFWQNELLKQARRTRDHPRQDRRDRSVVRGLRGDHRQPQPWLPRLVQQRRKPSDRPRSQGLAQAYAVHVLDVYDHYRFRYIIQTQGTGAFSGLEPDDKWQDKYFDPSNPASHDADV